MFFKPNPLPFDPTATAGLSEKLHLSHHQNNYAGAIKRLNAIREELSQQSVALMPGYALNGLKREELIATNSKLLHELYFDSLGGAGQAMVPAMELALMASFGSVARWREEFVAMGKALGGAAGWVTLVFVPQEGQLVNQWAADHTQMIAGGAPVLTMDMYEHAYHLDHGANVAAYVEAFMSNIAWDKVYARYQHAVHAVGEALAAHPDTVAAALLVDVRRAGVFANASAMLPDAVWKDPASVAQWAGELPTDRDVLVYCIYGHEVGRSTAMQLKARGVNARYLSSGIDAWEKMGKPVQAKA